MSNAEKIREWREAHTGERITGPILCDLIGSDLRGADLVGADLRYANLRGADLRDADLWGADLWGGLRVDGLPSGQATMAPTLDGWRLSVGCWSGTVDGLATLIARDEGWPEAEGEEVARRRPTLEALIALCRAHIVLHEDKLAAVVERWASAEVEP